MFDLPIQFFELFLQVWNPRRFLFAIDLLHHFFFEFRQVPGVEEILFYLSQNHFHDRTLRDRVIAASRSALAQIAPADQPRVRATRVMDHSAEHGTSAVAAENQAGQQEFSPPFVRRCWSTAPTILQLHLGRLPGFLLNDGLVGSRCHQPALSGVLLEFLPALLGRNRSVLDPVVFPFVQPVPNHVPDVIGATKNLANHAVMPEAPLGGRNLPGVQLVCKGQNPVRRVDVGPENQPNDFNLGRIA